MRTVGGIFVAAGVSLVLLVGCPGDDDTPADGTGGSAASAGTAGTAGAAGMPWDPVWHETAPKVWPSVGPENNPDCGPGCRVALNVPLSAFQEKPFDSDRVLGISLPGIAFAEVGSSATRLVPHPSDAYFIQPSLWGDRISYQRSFGIAHGQVEVMSLITGETKIAFEYTPATAGTNSVAATALGPNHVYWELGGLWSRHLTTGVAKYLTTTCFSYCPTATSLLCDSGRIRVIDPDTGEAPSLDYGGAWQTDGACSPDRTKYAWIDYRDPPGPGSGMLSRSGGETLPSRASNASRRCSTVI